MNTTTPLPTPETDAEARKCHGIPDGFNLPKFSYVTSAFASKLERERDEAREQLKAMREAIKEAWIQVKYAESGFAGLALRVCPNDSAVDLVLSRMTKALAKLQPFIKP